MTRRAAQILQNTAYARGIAPVLRIVAVGALALVVVRWSILKVARYTVSKTVVVEVGIRPAAGIVAVRALPGVVTRGRIPCVA
jgi:hypothetical protein